MQKNKHSVFITFVKQLFALFLLFSTASIFSQELPMVIPPSPTVANLMQFEEVPVNHYTGQPNISIPLFNASLHQGLALNIGLSYNTQGIKIDNVSGWTGTGWNLEAGGVVSRTVRGLPDEKRKGYGSPHKGTGVFHNTDFWNYDAIDANSRSQFTWNANGSSSDKYDHELDLFQFNFLGISGRFIIVKNLVTNKLETKLLTKNQNIKVDVLYDPNTYELHSFLITDTNGNRYTFDVIEELTSSVMTESQLQNGEFTGLQGTETTNVSSWYLSKIETSNSKFLARFEYTNSNEQYPATKNVSYNEFQGFVGAPEGNWNEIKNDAYNASVLPSKKSVSITTSFGQTKKVSKIILRNTITIEFLNISNHPETGGAILSDIIIKSNTAENKRYHFNYDITNRLWLTSIEEKAGAKTNLYTLEYNDKEGLPPFNSLSDDWGYNDGMNEGLGCQNPTFDKEAIKKGLLSKIIYPTGGVKEFVFEHNQITYQSKIAFSLPNSNPQAVKLSDDDYKRLNPNNWDSSQSNQFNFNTSTNQMSGQITVDTPQEVTFRRGDFITSLTNCNTTENELLFNSLIRITSQNPTSLYTHNIRLDQEIMKFNIPQGTFNIELIFLDNCAELDVDFCFNIKKYKSSISQFVYGGGVRIQQILFKDSNSDDIAPSKKINFSYKDPNDRYSSSGAIDGSINGLFKNYEQNYKRHLFKLTEVGCQHYYNLLIYNIKFLSTSKNSNIHTTQGQYVGYKTVDVIEQGNGFSRYTFTSAQDYASPTGTFNYPYTPSPNIDYKRGLLLKKQVFKQTNTVNIPGQEPDGKLNEVTNTYAFVEEEVAPTFKVYNYENCPWKVFYTDYISYQNNTSNVRLNKCDGPAGCEQDCIITYSNCGNIPYFMIKNYVKTGWAKLKTTTVKDYFYDANGNQNTTEARDELTYNDLNFQVQQKLSFFDEGDLETTLRTKYYYPVGNTINSNTTAIKNKLITLNKINEVIATETFKNGIKLSQTNTVYDEQELNLVLPKKTQIGKGTLTPEDRLEYVKYDSYGNLLEVKKESGTSVSYIWGYNNMYPVAKLENTTYATIENLSSFGIGFSITNDLSITQENDLRTNLPNTLVSTYKYKPLKGIISTTDPRNYTMYYEYNLFNRLKLTRDKKGNILNKQEYNYVNQN